MLSDRAVANDHLPASSSKQLSRSPQDRRKGIKCRQRTSKGQSCCLLMDVWTRSCQQRQRGQRQHSGGTSSMSIRHRFFLPSTVLPARMNVVASRQLAASSGPHQVGQCVACQSHTASDVPLTSDAESHGCKHAPRLFCCSCIAWRTSQRCLLTLRWAAAAARGADAVKGPGRCAIQGRGAHSGA